MENLKLNIIQHIPTNINECFSENILEYFSGPTLIELDVGKKDWLFISVLLHGNETVGLEVLKKINDLMKKTEMPKNLGIFIGNVTACHQEKRRLQSQPDFNRIWNTSQIDLIPLFAKELLEWASQRKLFSAIDIHNTTGKNPLYGCMTNISSKNLYLASLFSKTAVYFENPRNVLIRAFSQFCPSLVIECGLPGKALSTEKAFNFVQDIMSLANLEISEKKLLDLNLYHTIGRIVLKENKTFDFNPTQSDTSSSTDISFLSDIENYNFFPLKKGVHLGRINSNQLPVQVIDEDFKDITHKFLENKDGQLCLTRNTIPAMLTRDRNIILSDCLGYFMEPLKLPFHINNSSQ